MDFITIELVNYLVTLSLRGSLDTGKLYSLSSLR